LWGDSIATLVLDRSVAGEDVFLSAQSNAVTLVSGASTDMLKFRTPRRPAILKFSIMIDAQLTAAGDIFVINYIENGESQQKYAWKTINAAEIIKPITFVMIYKRNTEIELVMQWTAVGLVPAITANATAYGKVLYEGSSLF